MNELEVLRKQRKKYKDSTIHVLECLFLLENQGYVPHDVVNKILDQNKIPHDIKTGHIRRRVKKILVGANYSEWKNLAADGKIIEAVYALQRSGEISDHWDAVERVDKWIKDNGF